MQLDINRVLEEARNSVAEKEQQIWLLKVELEQYKLNNVELQTQLDIERKVE